MRRRTAALVLLVLLVLGGGAYLGLTLGDTQQGTLTERWVSPTGRPNDVNHHAVGVGPNGRVIVAPVAAVPGQRNLTRTSCVLARLSPEDGSVLWRVGMAPEQCFTHALSQPAIADVDGDGEMEVADGTTFEALLVRDASDGSLRYSVSFRTYGYGQPAVGNLTASSPGSEIVASDVQGNAVAVAGENDSVLWRYALDSATYASPVVADVDGNGRPDALLGSSKRVVLLDGDGGPVWTRQVGADTFTYAPTPSGQPDAFGASSTTLTALYGENGSVAWRADFDSQVFVHAPPIRTPDGRVVVVSLGSQRVAAVNVATGDVEWTTALGVEEAAFMPEPAVGDLTGDGTPEVVAVTRDGTVTVLDPTTGDRLASYDRGVQVLVYPTTADVDGDGADEILVRYGDGRVAALDYAA